MFTFVASGDDKARGRGFLNQRWQEVTKHVPAIDFRQAKKKEVR